MSSTQRSAPSAADHRSYPIRLAYICGILSILFAALAWWIAQWDLLISEGLRSGRFSRGDLGKAVAISEAFAHGWGVFAILASLLFIDLNNRRRLSVAIFMVILTGVVANLSKVVFPRMRPLAYTESLLAEQEPAVGETWRPVFSVAFGDWAQTSFPSGHSATAVSLAIGLAFVYPRGWWIFGLLACFAGIQRIVAGAHFPSDVLAGASLGAFLCGLSLRGYAFYLSQQPRHEA